jgi:hypothetical protein
MNTFNNTELFATKSAMMTKPNSISLPPDLPVTIDNNNFYLKAQ